MSGNKSGLLSYVTSVQVPGVKKFVAADAFGANNPAGIKFFLGGDLKWNFLGKIEQNVEPAAIAIYRLEKSSRNPAIMAELGAKKRIIKLAHFYQMLKAKAVGREDPLLINDCANIAYIEDDSGNLWAVNAR